MRGFTLVEVLVVVAVGAIAGGLLLQLFVQNSGLTFQQSAKVGQGIELNDATSIISNDIKSASAVALGYPEPSPATTSNGTNIVLKEASIDATGYVIDSTFDYIVISWIQGSPSFLKEELHPDPASSRKPSSKILIKNISQFVLTYMDSSGNIVSPPSATKINFVVNTKEKAGLDNPTGSSSARVSLRNN
jgi:prepilin-type N-terminal cleavage/methylation domain-containing protein